MINAVEQSRRDPRYSSKRVEGLNVIIRLVSLVLKG
jgi:hypothetical protein